jgi:glycosyltransferase involved in cell wall biosynthesis
MNRSNAGRVLIAAYEYHPVSVGAEARSSFEIVRSLRALGRRIVVLAPRTPNVPAAYGLVKVSRRETVYGGLATLTHYPEFLLGSASAARRLQARVNVCHQVSPMTFRFPSALASLDVPFVWGPVGGSIPYPPGFEKYGDDLSAVNMLRRLDFPRLRLDPLMRRTIGRAARIVVTSSHSAEFVPDRYRHKVVHIPDGMPPETVSAGPGQEQPYVFSSGRLIPYKAMDLLIHAFYRVNLRTSGAVRLVITGHGPERPKLEALIGQLGLSAVVDLVGAVPRAVNKELMRNSLCCVFPSLREAFGHVNLEAMGAWKPVVVTDWGGPRDIVVDGVTGFKVLGRNPSEHSELIADALLRLLDDGALRQRMGAAGAARVLASYSWSMLGNRYDGLYRELGA